MAAELEGWPLGPMSPSKRERRVIEGTVEATAVCHVGHLREVGARFHYRGAEAAHLKPVNAKVIGRVENGKFIPVYGGE